MKNRMYLIFVAVVGLIVLFFAASEKFHSAEMRRLDFLSHEKAELFVRAHSPVKGEKEAKIFVTEFLDPECESCRKMNPFVNKLLEDHKGKVKVVVRYLPLHRNSKFAIKVLEAARKQGKYWETLETLFKHQPDWGNHHSPRPDLIWVYLPFVGVDVDKVKRDMNDPEIEKMIEQDQSDAKTLGVRGTPTFFVNGKPLPAFGPEALKQAVQKEIELHDLN